MQKHAERTVAQAVYEVLESEEPGDDDEVPAPPTKSESPEPSPAPDEQEPPTPPPPDDENTATTPPPLPANLTRFVDLSGLDPTAIGTASWAVEVGLLQGYDDGTLRLGGTVTRAEMAELIWRYTEIHKRLLALPPEGPEGGLQSEQ